MLILALIERIVECIVEYSATSLQVQDIMLALCIDVAEGETRQGVMQVVILGS